MDNSSQENNIKRLFIGIKIELSEKTHETYSTIRQILKDSVINWVSPDNMHLTLKFIGEKPDFYINSINEIIAGSVKSIHEFDIKLQSVGAFGVPPAVIWVGVNEDGTMNTIFRNIDSSLSELGIKREIHPYSPHLTLGRIKRLSHQYALKEIIEKYKNIEFQNSRISQVLLFESILNPRGPIYKILSTHKFLKE